MISLTYQGLIQQLRPYFTQPVLKRGWQYYKDDTIDQFQAINETTVKAIVHGSVPYFVQLDLKQFRNSRCNCPVDGYCKHMAALLYETAYRAGLQAKQLLSPTSKLLSEPVASGALKEEKVPDFNGVQLNLDLDIEESPVLTGVSSGQGRRNNPGSTGREKSLLSPLKKPISPAVPKENGTAADWHRYFENQYERFSIYENGREMEELFHQAMERFLPFASGWGNAVRLIYGIHIILFLMKRTDELKAEMMKQHYYRLFAYTQTFTDIAEQCYVVMADMVGRVDPLEARGQHPGLVQETADYLSAHAFPEQRSSMPWDDVYTLLWRTLLFEPALMERERRRLDENLANQRLFPSQRDALVINRAFFDIMERNDRQARAWLEQELSSRGTGLIFSLLEGFAAERDWDRLVEWLQWLVPAVKNGGSALMETYFQYWQEAAKYLDLENEWKHVICSMLPDSYLFYSRMLFQQQQYREWVDLNVLFMRSPTHFSAAELKQVEAEDGRLLLPLYHLAVERYVMEKNRASYKSAVRLLKKLGALYKRLKETEQWERYVEQISKQYSRYRAFQEELRKGKLL